jgi:hypothetical protein
MRELASALGIDSVQFRRERRLPELGWGESVLEARESIGTVTEKVWKEWRPKGGEAWEQCMPDEMQADKAQAKRPMKRWGKGWWSAGGKAGETIDPKSPQSAAPSKRPVREMAGKKKVALKG